MSLFSWSLRFFQRCRIDGAQKLPIHTWSLLCPSPCCPTKPLVNGPLAEMVQSCQSLFEDLLSWWCSLGHEDMMIPLHYQTILALSGKWITMHYTGGAEILLYYTHLDLKRPFKNHPITFNIEALHLDFHVLQSLLFTCFIL